MLGDLCFGENLPLGSCACHGYVLATDKGKLSSGKIKRNTDRAKRFSHKIPIVAKEKRLRREIRKGMFHLLEPSKTTQT